MRQLNTPAIGYARSSEGRELSLQTQVDAIKRICEARGMDLKGIVEEAGSAFDGSYRGQFQKILQGIDGWGILVAYDLSRISRSWTEWLDILSQLDAKGKRILTCQGELDTSTADGWMLAMFQIVLACYQSRKMSETIRSGLERTNKRIGRHPRNCQCDKHRKKN